MNRRHFLIGMGAVAGSSVQLPGSALSLDTDIEVAPVLELFRLLPDSPAGDGFDFPVTVGIDGELQRRVWPENPDMYWDPEGEDYFTLFGFYPAWMEKKGYQAGVEVWKMNLPTYEEESTQTTLELNGWEMMDEDLRILRYTGDGDDRRELAASLNQLGDRMREGVWDWIALPSSRWFLSGASEDRLRTVVDRIVNPTTTSTAGGRFDRLPHLLRLDSYHATLLPPQRLPVASCESSFLSRCWTGDVPIVQSIGLQLSSETDVQRLVVNVLERLETQPSRLMGAPYSDFLEVAEILESERAVRFDFIAPSESWDVFNALHQGDLGMLPLEAHSE